MRRSVGWTLAGLASDGPWEELFHRAMLYGTTQTQIVPRVFTSEELARIEAPTLLVLGERERIYGPDKAARAARRLMPAVRVKLCTGTEPGPARGDGSAPWPTPAA